jgi:hypothetical protein
VTRKRKTSTDHSGHGPSRFSAMAVAQYVRSLRPLGVALFPPRVVVFVAMFAWYLWAVVDLRLVFQTRNQLFLWNVRYFTDFIGQPGSLLEWADRLLVQLCYHGWPGAIAIAAAAWLLLVSTMGMINALSRACIGGTWVIPAILLVVLFGRYNFPALALLGLALAMTAANVWCRTPVHRFWLRLVSFLLVSSALYYVVGEAYYCFAACCAIHEALAEKRRLSGLLFLLGAVAMKFGLDAVFARFDLASHNSHVPPLDRQQDTAYVVVLYIYFPLCALFVVLRQAAFTGIKATWRRLQRFHDKTDPQEDGQGPNGNEKAIDSSNRGAVRTRLARAIRWSAATVLALLLPAVAAFYSFDRVRKLSQEIDYCAEHELWDALLAKAKMLPRTAYSRYVNHDVNRALYHTGRLPYEILSYPQNYPPLFNVEECFARPASLCKLFDFLVELGRVGEAEHVALEMIELHPCGGSLKRLALAKLIRDQSSAASVVLKILRDDLVWGGWAEEYLRRLAVDPDLAGDEKIQRARRLMISEDDIDLTTHFLPKEGAAFRCDVALSSLLRHNADNRMAFEYLMTMYLCADNVRGAAEAFSFLNGLSYPTTPPLYEEAVLLYLSEHGNEATWVDSRVLFGKREISEPTMKKYRRLQAIAARFDGINEKAKADVARELSETYFYYFFYTSRKHS